MNLIVPPQQPTQTLRHGDLVVFSSGFKGLMCLYENDNDDYLLCLCPLEGGYISSARTPEEWLRYWDTLSLKYTIYSAEEWELKLVSKRQRVRIEGAVSGCRGAEGQFGYITDATSTHGLLPSQDGVNVKLDNGEVWRVNRSAVREVKA
jgi:hypothetical protein